MDSWQHLLNTGAMVSTPFSEERLTEIEKEEGEGDGKKEDVDDPEEEDHGCPSPCGSTQMIP